MRCKPLPRFMKLLQCLGGIYCSLFPVTWSNPKTPTCFCSISTVKALHRNAIVVVTLLYWPSVLCCTANLRDPHFSLCRHDRSCFRGSSTQLPSSFLLWVMTTFIRVQFRVCAVVKTEHLELHKFSLPSHSSLKHKWVHNVLGVPRLGGTVLGRNKIVAISLEDPARWCASSGIVE